jgi:hypothetical protein
MRGKGHYVRADSEEENGMVTVELQYLMQTVQVPGNRDSQAFI